MTSPMRYNWPLDNEELPQQVSVATAVKGIAGLSAWFSFDNHFCTTVGSNISQANSRVPSALSLLQTTDAVRPALTPGRINGWEAAIFSGAQVLPFSATVALDSGMALGVLAKITASTAGQSIIGSVTNSTNRFGLQVGGASGGSAFTTYAFCGTPTLSALTLPLNTWVFMLLEKDASKFQLRAGGLTTGEVSHSNATGTAAPLVGALNGSGASGLTGEIAEVMYFSRRIIGDTDAMGRINVYLQKIYGVSA